ncbi:SIMPL domain-containing protein [Deferribacteres bacterium DY0037]
MRLFLVLALSLAAGSTTFAGDMPLRINDTLTVTDSVAPDTMVSTITVSATSETFATAIAKMEQIASVVKNYSEICTFNSYRVTPKYRYQDSVRHDDGFSGYIYVPCEFNNMKPYNKLLNDINSVAENDNTFDISMSPVNWTVSKSIIDAARQGLKNELITQIGAVATAYSRSTKKNCEPSAITFSGASDNMPFEMAPVMRSAKASFDTSSPDKKNSETSVSAEFMLICK